MTQMTFARAINAGLRKSLENDPKVILMGEDIGTLGGVFRVTDGLQKDFGTHRVVDTPLAESAIMGTAVGLAYRGYRPVVEIQFDGFIYPAFDQIVSQVAKLHYRTQGAVKMPITVRVPFGGGIGSPEHHSESPEAYFTHTSGLRVVTVSNPQDAHTVIQQAIACPMTRCCTSNPSAATTTRAKWMRALIPAPRCPWTPPALSTRART